MIALYSEVVNNTCMAIGVSLNVVKNTFVGSTNLSNKFYQKSLMLHMTFIHHEMLYPFHVCKSQVQHEAFFGR